VFSTLTGPIGETHRIAPPVATTASQRVWVALVVIACALAYAVCAVLKHWHFDTSYDLAIYDQAIWHLSRAEPPASSIRGISNVFGDHFHPVIALLAPLVRIVPATETLLVAQAALLAVSIVPVFRYARSRLPFGPALAMSIAYGLFWGLQQTATTDFHEAAFAPLAMALLLLAAERRAGLWFWAAVAAVIAVKEDLLPVLAFLGAFLFVRGERRRGVALLITGMAAFVAVVASIIPALSDPGQYGYRATYSEALRAPWTIPLLLVTPPIKLLTALLWVAPFALLPLASPLCFLLIPFAPERFLSASPNHWGTIFHYSAPLAPVVAFAAVDGLARVSVRIPDAGTRRRTRATLAGVCVVFSAILPGHQPLWRLFSANTYRFGAIERSAPIALGLIPADATVVAQTCVAPHLAHRSGLFRLDADAPDADYVAAVRDRDPWPLASEQDIQRLLAQRLQRGYVIAFERDGWLVLRRESTPEGGAGRLR
jgi:uncharacterized membrane protein